MSDEDSWKQRPAARALLRKFQHRHSGISPGTPARTTEAARRDPSLSSRSRTTYTPTPDSNKKSGCHPAISRLFILSSKGGSYQSHRCEPFSPGYACGGKLSTSEVTARSARCTEAFVSQLVSSHEFSRWSHDARQRVRAYQLTLLAVVLALIALLGLMTGIHMYQQVGAVHGFKDALCCLQQRSSSWSCFH